MILFESILTTPEASTIFFEAAEAVLEISSCIQITNFNHVKLAQILDTHCVYNLCNIMLYTGLLHLNYQFGGGGGTLQSLGLIQSFHTLSTIVCFKYLARTFTKF